MVKYMHQVKEGDFMVGAAARYVTVHEDRAVGEVAEDIRQGINEMIAVRAVRWKIASNRRRVRLFGTRNWIGPGAAFAAHLSIRAHHEQTLIKFAGLNLTHRLDMLICVVGTTSCLRVEVVENLQSCDARRNHNAQDAAWDAQYGGTMALGVYKRKQDQLRKGLYSQHGKTAG